MLFDEALAPAHRVRRPAAYVPVRHPLQAGSCPVQDAALASRAHSCRTTRRDPPAQFWKACLARFPPRWATISAEYRRRSRAAFSFSPTPLSIRPSEGRILSALFFIMSYIL